MRILRSLRAFSANPYLKKPDIVTKSGVSGTDSVLNKLTYSQVQLDFGVNLLGFHKRQNKTTSQSRPANLCLHLI